MKTIALLLSLLFCCVSCTYRTENNPTTGDNIMRGDVGGMDTDEHGTPYSKVTGWSGSGDLITGNSNNDASAAADFAQPGDYTIQFSLVPQGPDSPPQVPFAPTRYWAGVQAIATIRWSVEGVTIVRKMSVFSGASISGVGQGFSVVVNDVTTTSSGNILLGRPYKVGITVAPGTRAADTIPPTLFPENQVYVVPTSAPVTQVPIPQNCGVRSVLVTVAADVSVGGTVDPIPEQRVQVAQTDANGTELIKYDPRSQFFCPIAPGAVFLNLINNGAAGPPDPSMLFSVTFGIDG